MKFKFTHKQRLRLSDQHCRSDMRFFWFRWPGLHVWELWHSYSNRSNAYLLL